jgi:hypothetical protein
MSNFEDVAQELAALQDRYILDLLRTHLLPSNPENLELAGYKLVHKVNRKSLTEEHSVYLCKIIDSRKWKTTVNFKLGDSNAK